MSAINCVKCDTKTYFPIMGNSGSTLEAISKNRTHTVCHSSLSVRSQLMQGMNIWNDKSGELIMVKFGVHNYNCNSS